MSESAQYLREEIKFYCFEDDLLFLSRTQQELPLWY